MHWFILGREKLLSAAEISAVLGYQEDSYDGLSNILKTPQPVGDPKQLIARLGGTIKIGLELFTNLSESELLLAAAKELTAVTGKIHFGISVYDDMSPPRQTAAQIGNWGKKIKQTLKSSDRSVRHVFNYEPILSSVTVTKNGLCGRGVEFLIRKNNGRFDLAKTVAVQPFEEFATRDFGRPGRDDLSGMLPPKLAMMMINLAQPKIDSILLDPFCGSGTIVSEAALLGYRHIMGTDISEKAIADSQTNFNWLKKQNPNITAEPQLMIADAQNLSSKITPQSIDAVITEPYLGKPLTGQETELQITEQAQTLKKLYITALKQIKSVLKSSGTIVFIVPRFKHKNGWITINIQDDIKDIGLATAPLLANKDYLLYARPNQKVGREIWRFVSCQI